MERHWKATYIQNLTSHGVLFEGCHFSKRTMTAIQGGKELLLLSERFTRKHFCYRHVFEIRSNLSFLVKTHL